MLYNYIILHGATNVKFT